MVMLHGNQVSSCDTYVFEAIRPDIYLLGFVLIDVLFLPDGGEVVILDAAVLFEAGWETMCHEVWTAIVPKPEVRCTQDLT